MSVSELLGARAAGFLGGLGLIAVLAIGAWGVPGATRPAVARVDLRAVPTGEVGVAPAGSVFRGRTIVPGGAAVSGSVRLTNRTAGPRLVRARAAGGDAELGALVAVTLKVRGRVVYDGPLAGLDGRTRPFALAEGGAETVDVSARIARSAAREAAARAGRWILTFEGAR